MRDRFDFSDSGDNLGLSDISVNVLKAFVAYAGNPTATTHLNWTDNVYEHVCTTDAVLEKLMEATLQFTPAYDGQVNENLAEKYMRDIEIALSNALL